MQSVHTHAHRHDGPMKRNRTGNENGFNTESRRGVSPKTNRGANPHSGWFHNKQKSRISQAHGTLPTGAAKRAGLSGRAHRRRRYCGRTTVLQEAPRGLCKYVMAYNPSREERGSSLVDAFDTEPERVGDPQRESAMHRRDSIET